MYIKVCALIQSDKKVLENYETEIAWNVFRGISNHYVSEENDLDETFEFGDSKQIEYEELMENKICLCKC